MKKRQSLVQGADSPLRLDWCGKDAAKYACEKWHYSHSLPAGKLACVGAWEGGEFIGCVVFGRGANRNMAAEFGLTCTQCVELVRVALHDHAATVSRIVAIAIRFLRKQSPALRLIVSYADPEQGHVGGIYQAMNWIYLGPTKKQRAGLIDGKQVHKRTVHSLNGTITGTARTALLWKHKYALPLTSEMAATLVTLRKPYPKRVESVAGDTPANHAGMGGSIPTSTL